jgi:protein TonB
VSLPKVVRQVSPNYTSDAMSAGIQGTVVVEAAVLADGTVGDVKVVRSLDPEYRGLDDRAVSAVKQWRFKPGMKDGEPVAVRVQIDSKFVLSSANPNTNQKAGRTGMNCSGSREREPI